ncbi:MAG: hypothetical protein K2K97_00325 [Muribaculaceae bacterium]|nr:hypothetical protein [Muribaculaceae bacterium]
MTLPEDFKNQMEQLLGNDSDAFLSAMTDTPSVSIKLNRRKTNDPAIIGYGELEPVKWCSNGYYLPVRPKFTLNPLLHAGVFYVQDASSMIYEAIAEKVVPSALDTGAPLRVLDLCAAPGGKTTSIINALPDGSVVVANEFIASRAQILRENLIKWGYPDIIVTNSPTSVFARMGEVFDIVAVDAPCSGEGMMRKEDVAVTQWNAGLQKQCASLQKDILSDAFEALKPGGFLIYSTCTFNRLENEENLKWLAEEKGLIPVDMEFPEEWELLHGIDTAYPCYRFMPHKTRGEGLFVAVLRKEGDYPRAQTLTEASFHKTVKANARVIAEGIPLTTVKGKDAVPTSESVLATDFNRDSLPSIEVDESTALSYLRHEALRFGNDIGKGFVVINYKGFPLGLVKNIGNRANNLYPSQWRIKFL